MENEGIDYDVDASKSPSFNKKQLTSLILTIVVNLSLAVVFFISLVPIWLVTSDLTGLYLSWILGLAILLIPTQIILRYGWPDKISSKTYLLPLRLGLAYTFLHGAWQKFTDPAYLANPGLIGYGAAAAPSPWVQAFLTGLLTNYAFFLLLIAVGELLVGLSMFFGGFTRLGALGGILLQMTFLFLLGWLSLSTFSANSIGFLSFYVIGIHRGGRFLGLDQLWGQQLENSRNPIAQFLSWFT